MFESIRRMSFFVALFPIKREKKQTNKQLLMHKSRFFFYSSDQSKKIIDVLRPHNIFIIYP